MAGQQQGQLHKRWYAVKLHFLYELTHSLAFHSLLTVDSSNVSSTDWPIDHSFCLRTVTESSAAKLLCLSDRWRSRVWKIRCEYSKESEPSFVYVSEEYPYSEHVRLHYR